MVVVKVVLVVERLRHLVLPLAVLVVCRRYVFRFIWQSMVSSHSPVQHLQHIMCLLTTYAHLHSKLSQELWGALSVVLGTNNEEENEEVSSVLRQLEISCISIPYISLQCFKCFWNWYYPFYHHHFFVSHQQKEKEEDGPAQIGMEECDALLQYLERKLQNLDDSEQM